MCDYGLHNVTARPARVGDKLVSTKFKNSITRGFAAVGEPDVAVYLLAGTEVAFEMEVEYEHGWSVFSNRKVARKVARFRLVDMDKPNVHHHALEFPDGHTVLVTRLCDGQCLTVLQLPAAPRTEKEVEERKSGAVVI